METLTTTLRPAARTLRRLTILLVSLAVAITGLVAAGHTPMVVAHASSSFDSALFALINQDRAAAGLPALHWNQQLGDIAETNGTGCSPAVGGRAGDLIKRDYFSHQIPGCKMVFDIMNSQGITYSYAGENIGYESNVSDEQKAAQDLNTAYMNSPEHKANILNSSFTDVGVGSWMSAPGTTWTGGGSRPMSAVMMSVEDFIAAPPGQRASPGPLSPDGYWLAGADGAVFPFGAGSYGQQSGNALNQPIVGVAAPPDKGGYWLVARDGGVFSFGGAHGYGSTGGIHLNQPIVGMAATPSGRGYWLVASDGGIFPFGDAGGFGSTGGIHLNKPIVGMTATPSGQGYWLVASDGGIFPFGDAGGYGSTGGIHLNQPIVGMTSTGSGGGYWLVARDGGIFPFGDAPGLGSTGGMRLARPIVGMAHTSSGNGYWLVAGDGGIFPFGDAPGLGSTGSIQLAAPIIGMAS